MQGFLHFIMGRFIEKEHFNDISSKHKSADYLADDRLASRTKSQQALASS